MGSVKDLKNIKKPTENAMGIGRFHFSDRYSVFDWGEMPDHIEGKGAALCLMGAYCFERLEERGVKTHYRGLVRNDGAVKAFTDLDTPTNVMEFDRVNVIKPKTYQRKGKLVYDYNQFQPNQKNYLIPLEIIYRNGLPEGSSIFKRLANGSITLQDLGLDVYPKPGVRLGKPIFDVSTKLEETDRYISWTEAKNMAGFTDAEIEEAKSILSTVNTVINEIAARANLENEDGKIELAFDNERKLMIVDVVGTLDECRFTYQDIHVSKEIARLYYRKTKWYQAVEHAKKSAEERGIKEWKTLCRLPPPPLDPRLKTIMSRLYKAATNVLTNRMFFAVPSLERIVEEYQNLVKMW